MRIAIRESRAVLQLFERQLNAAAAGNFDARLRSLGEIFGAARDWDVFCLETLSAAMTDLSCERFEDLNFVAEVERQIAHATVARAVHGRDFMPTDCLSRNGTNSRKHSRNSGLTLNRLPGFISLAE